MELNITASPPAITPKALANFSPGFERSENPGCQLQEMRQTLKGFLSHQTPSGLIYYLHELTQSCRYAPTLG